MERILLIEGHTGSGLTTAAVGGAFFWALRQPVLFIAMEGKAPPIPHAMLGNRQFQDYFTCRAVQPGTPAEVLIGMVRHSGAELVVVDPLDLVKADEPRPTFYISFLRRLSKAGKCAAWGTVALARDMNPGVRVEVLR